jgi:hypothetical protein
MTEVLSFDAGGYRFIKGVFQYSGGVAAKPGYAIVRVRFREPVPLEQGFKRIREVLARAERPLIAFCACELRSPAPFTESGFHEFNELYVGTLKRWRLFDGAVNPVARSNVCPAIDPPSSPSFHAFAYTQPSDSSQPSFIVSGGAEAPEDRSNYRDHIIRLGDVSPSGLKEKARWVLAEMQARLSALGFTWGETSATSVYTVHDIYPFFADEIVRRGAAHDAMADVEATIFLCRMLANLLFWPKSSSSICPR